MEEEQSTREVSEPSKKSNTALIIILVILVVLGVGGYLISKFVINKVAEKGAETLIGAATGGKVDVDTSNNSVTFKDGDNSIEVNGGTWPADMPAPKYSSGKVEASTKLGSGTDQGWSVTISGTSQAQFDTYKSELGSAGWTQSTDSLGEAFLQYSKDKYDLTAVFDSSSNGVSITVTISQ